MTAGPQPPPPHGGGPVARAGVALSAARAAVIMTHGRGATAESILDLAAEVDPGQVAYLAPQARGNTWYPNSFLAPLASNEPGLSSGLAVLGALLAEIAAAGIPPERTALLGFSQGACLTLEFAARHARRYGALIGLSGGLIGPDGAPRDYRGDFAGAPVFLGCSDVDPHIPRERVEETADVLRRMGADVTARLYRGMGHTVNADEIARTRALLQGLVS
jgi:phospholipase/carboxylesterase